MQACLQVSDTTNTVVSFEWTEPDNGGSDILGYVIASKFIGEEDFVELASNYNELYFQITQDVVEGAEYQFIIKAENRWGYAEEWSEPCTILAATWPTEVTDVESKIDSLTGGIQITWQEAENRGTPLTSYQVEIQNSLGEFTLQSTCGDGLGLSCLIPMSAIIGAQLSLTYD
jgi:hypothetical protein